MKRSSQAAPEEPNVSHWLLSPKATNSIAGGNATGLLSERRSDPERVEYVGEFDPYRVENRWCPKPVALPPAIEFVAFGDTASTIKSSFMQCVFHSDHYPLCRTGSE